MRLILSGSCALLLGAAWAQPSSATKADSGWVPLCNGRDLTGLYDYATGTGIVNVNAQSNFTVEAGTIHVKGSPSGYLGTIRQYSHYHVRVDYQWPAGTLDIANSGLLIHLDSAAVFSGSVTTVGRPRSIEVNCRRDGGYPWSLWSAGKLGPYITTTVTSAPAKGVQGQYNPAGIVWTDDPWAGDSRVVSGDYQANPEAEVGQWNHGEAYVYGDSGVFILNGQVRTRGRNFQIRLNPNAASPRIPCTKGNIGLQSEGYPISFRNFEIMELDSLTHIPIHARRGCTQRSAANYDSRAVVDDGSCAATALLGKSEMRIGGALRPRSGARVGTQIAFPVGTAGGWFFDLGGRSICGFRHSAAGIRLPADASRAASELRFFP